MRKLLQMMAVILSATLLSDASAAKTPSPTFGGATIPNPASSGQVMSNDAFKGTVNKLGSETTKNLGQTVQQQIKSSAANPSPTAPSSSTATDTGSSTSTKQSQPATDTDIESEDITASPPKAQTPSPNRQAKPAATPTQPASSPPPTSSEVYTGFGAGQTNQKSTGGSSQDGKSGGWNVGY